MAVATFSLGLKLKNKYLIGYVFQHETLNFTMIQRVCGEFHMLLIFKVIPPNNNNKKKNQNTIELEMG